MNQLKANKNSLTDLSDNEADLTDCFQSNKRTTHY